MQLVDKLHLCLLKKSTMHLLSFLRRQESRKIVILDNYYTLWSLPQVQISVIPACPESFRKDSRRALLAGMTKEKSVQNCYKHHTNYNVLMNDLIFAV
jgi:hypothetical protein